jgi:hypothetical protein
MQYVKKWFNRAAETARGLRRAIGSFWSRTGPTRQRWRVFIVAAVLFLAGLCTVIAFLPGQVTSAYDWVTGASKKEGAWGDLRIQPPVSLTDGDPRQTQIGISSHWIRATLPQIDFTVRNEGAGRIPLSRIRIEVTDSTRLTSCLLPQGGEGGIPVAEAFTVSLPLLPAASEKVVYRNLHQEVLPQRASQFKLYLRSLEGEFGDNLFAIDVSLLGTEAGETLHVGRFVLSLPGALSWESGFFPTSAQAFEDASRMHSLLPTTWCYRRNLAMVRRFLSLPGKRSPAMQALSPTELPGDWEAMADQRPAAAAVGPLLHSGDFFLGPILALFAAERADDPSLLAGTRSRAVAVLRHSIESSLEEDPVLAPTDAVVDARLLKQLAPSDEATLLLQRSEAALSASEASSSEGAG